MFRALSGFKAQCDDLSLMVVSEFDEWRVIVHGPGVLLQGSRQYGQAKAKDHALLMAKAYLEEVKGKGPQEIPEPDWQPTAPEDWLVWKS